MRSTTLAVLATFVLSSVGFAPPASGKETVDSALARLVKLDEEQAMKMLGKIARRFPGDPVAEKKIADDIERRLMKADEAGDAARLSRMLAALLGELDPKRSGAFVSAHAYAREALIAASRSGERLAVPVAAKVLEKYGRGRHRGLSGQTMSIFARAFDARIRAGVDQKKILDAVANLEVALGHCVDNQWFEMATVVATEVAEAHLATGKPRLAVEAIERAAASVPTAYPDLQILVEWNGSLRTPAPDHADALCAPVVALIQKIGGRGAQSGGAGGHGKPGLDAGEDPATELGRAWRRMKKRAPIVTATRKGRSIVMRLAYTREKDRTFELRTGEHSGELGDVQMTFHGMAVALHALTLEKPGTGLPGRGPVRRRFVAWTLLAEDEVWSVARDGTVRVR